MELLFGMRVVRGWVSACEREGYGRIFHLPSVKGCRDNVSGLVCFYLWEYAMYCPALPVIPLRRSFNTVSIIKSTHHLTPPPYQDLFSP